ncbi:MAG: cytidine deaminase, partial [Christensenellaceae bacterium]|nr:cytidine deaminase [Christensenellaceae bacterium]
MEKADKWDLRFMELANTVANWSSCFKEERHVGAVIVKDKRILTTG